MRAFDKHSSLLFECVNYMQTKVGSSTLILKTELLIVAFVKHSSLLYEFFYTYKPCFYILGTVCTDKIRRCFCLKICDQNV